MTERPPVRLEILSQPRFVCAARAMVNALAERTGFNPAQCGQISLAVDEALTNVIKHGYERRTDGRIRVSVFQIDSDPPAIKVMIEDRGKQVDPQTIRSRDLDDIRPGGLGVHIIKEIMDTAEFTKRKGGGMRLTMTKRLVASDGSAAALASQSATSSRSYEPRKS